MPSKMPADLMSGELSEVTRQVEELLDLYRGRAARVVEDPRALAERIVSLARRLEELPRPQPPHPAVAGRSEVEDVCGRYLTGLSRLFFSHFISGRPKVRGREARRIIFLAANGGLCNRLRALCALSVVSELLQTPLCWTWTPDAACPGSLASTRALESLGQMDFSILAEILLERLSDTLVLTKPDPAAKFYRRFVAPTGVDEATFKELYRKYQRRFLAALTESCGLGERIETARRRLPPEYCGVHVRRTDKIQRWQKLRPGLRFPGTEDYAEILDERLDSSERFFLCCDDSAALSELRSRYGARAVTFPGEFGEGFRQTGLEHAIADLVLLSGASLVVGTPESSFSSFAIHVGNAEARWPCSLSETFDSD